MLSLAPMLQSGDLRRTIDWYQSMLGFRLLEFAIKDPDGYLLSFGQDLPEAPTAGGASA